MESNQQMSAVGQQQISQNPVSIKLNMGGVTKKTKEQPKGIEALKLLVQAHLIEGAELKEGSGFTIEYQDEDKDNIAILDDDDLILAYEWAQEHSNNDLKLIIKPLKTKQRKVRTPKEGKKGYTSEPQETETGDAFQKPKKERKNKQYTATGDQEVEFTTKPYKARRERRERADGDQWKQKKMMKKIIKQAIKEHTKKVLEGVDSHNVTESQDGYFKVETTSQFPDVIPFQKKDKENKEKGSGVHYQQRGKILEAPTSIITAKPSSTVQFQIGMRNNTHYAYKPDSYFVSVLDDSQKELFEEVKEPLEQVQAMTDYKISFALKIKDKAVPCSQTENNKEYYEVKFQLLNPKGKLFGQVLTLKVKVDEANNDIVRGMEGVALNKESAKPFMNAAWKN